MKITTKLGSLETEDPERDQDLVRWFVEREQKEDLNRKNLLDKVVMVCSRSLEGWLTGTRERGDTAADTDKAN